MRTNIDIDDALMAEAMTALGLQTKKAVVERALQLAIDRHRRIAAFEDLEGLGWAGDLDAMRSAQAADEVS